MSKALAAKLVRVRKQLGLNQGEMGKALGVSQSAVSIWEKGKGEPKRANLIALAEMADIPLVHLMDEKTMNKQIKIDLNIYNNGLIEDSDGGYVDTMIAIPDGVRAAQLNDDTMAPFAKGWVMLYSSNRKALEEEDINQLCIIGMAGHGRRIGFVRKDRPNDKLWVEVLGKASPIFDPKVQYAYPIINIQTR